MPHVTPDLTRLYSRSDALALAGLVKKGEVSPSELVETAIAAIEALDPKLNAVVIRHFDLAREAAAAPPSDGLFAGVPFLLKNIGSSWKGTRLDGSIRFRENFVCGDDSEMARRMRASGLIPLGRSNVPENGWCIATEPRLYGPTINPWNEAVTPGGSSGGSAAAVAARLVPLAEASDGGGSIRVPASCCGLLGLKPSRGRIPYGPPDADIWFGCVYFFALTRTVRDSAAFLDATAGNLPGDPYVPPRAESGTWLASLAQKPRRLRIGYTLSSPWGPPFAPQVKAALKDTVALLEAFGHHLEEHRVTADLEKAWIDYNQVNAVEIARDLDAQAEWAGRPLRQDDLMAFNWAQYQRGRSQSATGFSASFAGIRKAGRDIAAELAPYDAFLTPTLTQLPRPVGYWDMNEPDFDAYIARWTDAAFMFAFNISGLPAISVPALLTTERIPVGVQLVGRYGDEATLLRLAAMIENARPWIQNRPGVCVE
ncbi:amidase [Labrys miyagiensis]